MALRPSVLASLFLCTALLSPALRAADYPIIPVPFSAVEMTDDFWRPRLELQRKTLVPVALERTQQAVADLQAAADVLATPTPPEAWLNHAMMFRTSDLYKVLEGAAYLLKVQRDPALESRLDRIAGIIAAAQEPDGYLYPAHTLKLGKQLGEHIGPSPYSHLVWSHELYNLGHLYEAAVAYHEATGKDNLLRIAEKSAEHVNRVFFLGDPRYNDGKPVLQADGHEEIELALVKLHRATGKPLYLDLARKFLEIRGVTYRPAGKGIMDPTYAQQHAPVKEQREPIGHAVRAMYLYSGMADVSALTGDAGFRPALHAIWQDLVDTRMHLTGGLGAVPGIEGFGPRFVLPNEITYDETCAAVANVLFNLRMFRLEGEAKYLDVAEVALLNNVLAGVNLQGDCFFYVNPLEANGRRAFNLGSATRSPWFDVACCPTNLARLIPQVPGMLYAHRANDLYCTFYAGSRTNVRLQDTTVALTQETAYPNDGRVVLTLAPDKSGRFRLLLRVPTWTGIQFLPGELYHFTNPAPEALSITVNGEAVTPVLERGFAVLDREWRAGDRVELNLPMPLRFTAARPEVQDDLDRVAATRGPLVLCAEGVDNGGATQRFFLEQLPDSSGIEPGRTEIPGTGSFIDFKLPAKALTADGQVANATLKLIPYYAWNNRGISSMTVWLPRKRSQTVFDPLALPKESPFREVRASSTSGMGDVNSLADTREPKNSADVTVPHWENHPAQGQPQWVEATFAGPRPVRSLGVYWYADGEYRRLPASWSVEVRQDGRWLPFKLYVSDSYGLHLDRYNVIHPAEPLTCDAIRLRLNPAPDAYMAAIHEIAVEFD